MKGIVFKEFIDLVENQFGADVADKIIEENELDSDGAYTSVGTYNHEEILKLVTSLSKASKIPVSGLVKTFGKHLIKVFTKGFPNFFAKDNCFEFLKSIDDSIHVEVKKLYPDAELPKFTHNEPEDGKLNLHYESSRPFADLAEGLIEGAIEHYGEKIELNVEDPDNLSATKRTFQLSKVA